MEPVTEFHLQNSREEINHFEYSNSAEKAAFDLRSLRIHTRLFSLSEGQIHIFKATYMTFDVSAVMPVFPS